jgi:hypothetical protein
MTESAELRMVLRSTLDDKTSESLESRAWLGRDVAFPAYLVV